MLIIHLFSHHFALIEPNNFYQSAIIDFVRTNLVQVQKFKKYSGATVTQVSKVFAFRRKVPAEYRFQINCLPAFLDHMSNRGITDIRYVHEKMYEPAKADFKIVTTKKPFDYQLPVIEYMVSDGYRKVVSLQTGQGKTLSALFAIAQIAQRTVLIIKPMYIKRWLDDVANANGIYYLSPKELVVVQGSGDLATILTMAVEGTLNYKFLIISNRTFANYIKDYKEGVSMEKYANVSPMEFFQTLKVGVRLIDEAHQDFYACFMADLFTHVPKSIELSATLEPDDKFLTSMYEIIYPREMRFAGGEYVKYIDVISVPYKLDPDIKQVVRFNQKGRISYSHNVMEESILKSKKRSDNFLQMIEDLTKKHFIDKRHQNYKLLIFCSRVDMCELVATHLSLLYPNLKITKYTQEEDYSILTQMDIIVSTPISSGTAVDIPKLQVVINTVAIGSTQANLQMIGRLRQLRDVENLNPTFIYTYCQDIDKHVEYHRKKRDITFRGKVLSYLDLQPAIYSV